ncbi:MAG TPA: GDP-mannose 4,6-dehydratase [Byssovorax sp.]|jgi:UDP-glucuronate 4-epimerase
MALTVVVTGCAGFIGSHVTEALLADGAKVHGVDCFDDYYPPALKVRHLAAAQLHPRFELSVVDLADAQRVQGVAARVKPDVVVHLAAVAGVRLSVADPARYVRANVVGTQNVLDAWSRGPHAAPLVVASSSSVYGNGVPAPYREDGPLGSPPSPYAATKRATELLAACHQSIHGGAVTLLRFFTVYGPRQRPDLAIRKFATAILRGEPVTVFGDGEMARDFTHVSDVVRGVRAAMASREGLSVVNLGNDSPVTVNELVEKVGAALGTPARVDHVPRPVGEMDVTWASIERAKERWAWAPQVKLDDGLADFAAWLRAEEAAGHNLTA